MNDLNQHYELSRALIGAILDFPALLEEPELSALQAGDMYGDFGMVLTAMRGLHHGEGITVANLVGSLPANSEFTLVYFNRLRQDPDIQSRSVDVVAIAEMIRSHRKRVDLNRIAGELAGLARNGDVPVDVIAGMVAEKLYLIQQDNPKDDHPFSETIDQIYEEVYARVQDPKDVWGVPYGFTRLDYHTGGMHAGELTYFSGEPGVGKTWWATQAAVQASAYAPGAIFSLEMKEKAIGRRILQILGANGRQMNTGRMDDGEYAVFTNAVEHARALPIFLDDNTRNLQQIRAKVARYISKHGIKWMILDYARLVDAPGKDDNERTQYISAGLKRITTDLDIPCLALASVNKTGMDGGTGKTSKAAVSGSGQQIHDADNIFILTQFDPIDDADKSIQLNRPRASRIRTLHIEKARNLEFSGGSIHYERTTGPRFSIEHGKDGKNTVIDLNSNARIEAAVDHWQTASQGND